MANTLEVEVRAGVAEFQKQMQEAAAVLRQTAQQMGASFSEGVTKPAEQAGAEVISLSERLREHGKEHVQTARSVRRFTAELEGIVGPGNEATKVLGGLLGGFAIGGAMGLAIEAFKLIVEHTKSAAEEEQKAKDNAEGWFKEVEKRGAEAAKALGDIADKIDHINQAQKFEREIAPMTAQLDALNAKLAEQKKIVADFKALNISEALLKDNKEYREAAAAVDDLTKKVNTLAEARAKVMAQANLDAANQAAANERDARNKQADAEQKAREQAEKQAQADRERAAAEQRKAEEQALAERAKLEEQFRQKDIAADKWWEDQKTKGLQDAAKRAKQILDAQDAEEIARQQDLAQQVAQQARVWEHMARSISDAFAMGFTQALFHASSFEDGIKAVFDGIEKAFERMIEQMIAKLVLSGVLSLLGSLIGGPVGAQLGLAGGNLFSNLFSFDVGSWGVPNDMVAQVHQGEIIVPPGASADIRSGRAALGAVGGGSTHNTFTIYAFDGPDVERSLLKIRNRLQRNGRW